MRLTDLREQYIIIIKWTKVKCAFAIEWYFANGRLIMAMQYVFHTDLNLPSRGCIVDWQSIV